MSEAAQSSAKRSISEYKYFIVLIWALLLAATLTFLTYPGIIYSDSYARLSVAADIATGNVTWSSWLSWLPSYIMAFSYKIVNSWAFYTFVQASFFFFSSFLVVIKIVRQNWGLAVLLMTTPTFLAYSVYHEMSVVTISAILCAYLLVLFLRGTKSRYGFLIALPVLALMCFLFIGYRQNAFTVLPVFLAFCVIFSWKKGHLKSSIKRSAIIAGPILAGVIAVFFFTNVLIPKPFDSSSAGFVWEILHVINELPDDTQPQYQDYLDEVVGEGDTQAALEVVNYYSVNSIFEFTAREEIGQSENSDIILQKYIEIALQEPVTFLNVKMKFIANSLGTLTFREYDYNRWESMDEYRFNDTPRRLQFVEGYNSFAQSVAPLRAPWICFAVALAALLYQWWRKDRFLPYLFLYLIAVFYYGAFLINTQSFEFRYFFPSYHILYIIVMLSLVDGGGQLVRYIMKKRTEKKLSRDN